MHNGTSDRSRSDPVEEVPGASSQASHDEGPVAEAADLAAVVAAALKDIARLLDLEARLLLRAVLLIIVLGIFLGLVLAASWIAVSVALSISIQNHTALGMAGAALIAAGLNLLIAVGVVLVLKRLARRLTFPETRLALRTLWPNTPRPPDTPS